MSESSSNKVRIAYIISDLNYSIAFEWIAKHFINSQTQIEFIFLAKNCPELKSSLEKIGVKANFIELDRGWKAYLKAFRKLYTLLSKSEFDMVHCHLLKANLLGLSTAYLLRIKRRIHTRHHSTFHHLHYPKGVMIDRLINSLSTDIVAISENVQHILMDKEGVKPNKVHLIRHGFKLDAFTNVDADKANELSLKYGLPDDKLRIGVIARFINWKGHRYIIEAFKKLLNERNDCHLILANSTGPDSEVINQQLKDLPESSYTLIPFENDIFSLYDCFDLYLHVPVDEEIEAFGQTYIEALAAGVPSVFTLSGIAKEFIRDHENALVVPFKDSDSIYRALLSLLNDSNLMEKLSRQGRSDVKQFDLEKMTNSLKQLYLKDI